MKNLAQYSEKVGRPATLAPFAFFSLRAARDQLPRLALSVKSDRSEIDLLSR